MVANNYFKVRKNQIRLFIYFLLTCTIWYHVLNINSDIKLIYEWENSINNVDINTGIEQLNNIVIDVAPKTIEIDKSIKLSQLIYSIVWNLIGILMVFVVILILYINELIQHE